VTFQNEKVYSLRPEYTYDGGHLTEAAQQRIASELVVFLARALDHRSNGQAGTTVR
jgi:lysophospholipase L1-like esterase